MATYLSFCPTRALQCFKSGDALGELSENHRPVRRSAPVSWPLLYLAKRIEHRLGASAKPLVAGRGAEST